MQRIIYLHAGSGKGYSVVLITDQNIDEYVDEKPDFFHLLSPAHQADFVRVCVLYKYGGIWLDSDTIVLGSLDSLFDIIESSPDGGFFINENNRTIVNGVFGTQKNTPLMREWQRGILFTLRRKKSNFKYTEIGNDRLQIIKNSKPELYSTYTIFNGLDTMYPVNWDKSKEEYIDMPYDHYKTIIREYQPLLVLVHDMYCALEGKTEKEILEGNMPVGYFLNMALGVLPQAPTDATNTASATDTIGA